MNRLIALAAGTLAAGVLVIGPGVAPAGATPGPASAPEYWFDSWHINELWDQGARGQGIRIAEIDTGVNASLPELTGRILSGKDFGQPGGNGQVDREIDEFGHGTAMASIMVGRPGLLGITGIAPDARVLPIAVPLTGTTDAASDDRLAAAITWAADHGAKVISMSLGGTRNPASDSTPCPSDEQAAIYYAIRKGAVLLAAGGNQGPTDNAVEEPGVCLGVVAVGAVDSSGTVASFSSRHPYLTLAAPGVLIPSLSRVPGTAYYGKGTSQATAIASAVLALVWSKYPQLTGSQVLARVLATLDQHRSTPSSAYGYGVLDGYQAVTANVPTSAPDPVFAAAAPFVARDRALSAARPNPPKPAPAPVKSTGAFEIGSSPRVLVPRVLTGLGFALAGLLALVALIAVGLLRRRRHASRTPPQASAGPAPVSRDATGMEWHEILNPQAPAPE